METKMSRQFASAETVQGWICDYPELVFDGVELLCTVCKMGIKYTHKNFVTRHVATHKHKTSLGEAPQIKFNLELVKFLVGCNIPWRQLDNPLFREFINNCIEGQYMDLQLPYESTLRKAYLPKVADNVLNKIRSEVEGKYIWLSIDETASASGYNVVNILVGALEELHATRGHLLASKVINDPNADIVATIVSNSLKQLWGDGFDKNKDKLILFITDDAAHMKASGQLLQNIFNFLHVTCLAHALHHVADTVRECYPKVDKLIFSVKQVFRKAPERNQLFCQILPHIEQPPEPILTRCGTWIEAASYYFMNLEDIKRVLQGLDATEAGAIGTAQEVAMDPTVPKSLQEIHFCYSRIPLAIQQLEQHPQAMEFSLTRQMNIIYELKNHLRTVQGKLAERVKQKFNKLLDKNPGISTISLIEKLLCHKEVDFAVPGIHEPSLRNYTLFRYAPLICVDVEHTFSVLKWIFSDRRHSLSPAHLEQLLLIYSFYCTADHDI